jgi:tetratricopeptide (TPR) repeat protein
MAAKPGLEIATKSARVSFRGEDLKLTRHWVYVYGLLALRTLENEGQSVSVKEINRLPTWTHLQERSVATSIFRHVESMRVKGSAFISSPPNERTKWFTLDTALVGPVKTDVNLDDLRAWLGLSGVSRNAAYFGTPEAAKMVTIAEATFEQGRMDEVDGFVDQMLSANPSKDQTMQALMVRAWKQAFTQPTDVAFQAVEVLHAFVKRCRDQERDIPVGEIADRLSPSCEALAWVQEARLYLWSQRFQNARVALGKAAKLLHENNHRELSAVEFGYGYIAQEVSGDLEEAESRYARALMHASKAHWPWGVGAQLANLAAVTFKLYERYVESDPVLATRWLDCAIARAEHQADLAEHVDYGGAADLETNLAFAYRVKGDLDRCDVWVTKALRVTRVAGNTRDLGLAIAERAELEFARDERHAALESWREAFSLLEGAGASKNWLQAVRHRISELEAVLPLGKALKLW